METPDANASMSVVDKLGVTSGDNSVLTAKLARRKLQHDVRLPAQQAISPLLLRSPPPCCEHARARSSPSPVPCA